MVNGDRRRSFASLVLARPGTVIPAIPEEFAGYVRVDRVQGLNTHDVPMKSYDEWLVTNAKAGFTGRGSLRLQDKKGRTLTWISGKDMQNIIGVDGSGVLKRNHRVCFTCGHRAIYNGEYFDENQNCKVVMFKCVSCGAVKRFPKRPSNHKSRKRNTLFEERPPKLIRTNPNRLPVISSRN